MIFEMVIVRIMSMIGWIVCVVCCVGGATLIYMESTNTLWKFRSGHLGLHKAPCVDGVTFLDH